MDNFGFRLDRDENDYDQNYQDDVDVHKPEDESSFKSSSCDTDFLYYSDKLFTIEESDADSDRYSRTDTLRSDERILVERHVFSQSRLDENFKRNRRPEPTIPQRAARKISKYFLSCSPSCLRGFMFNLFPFLTIMKDYNIRTDLSGDIIAGLTVGIMHIPQGMAYGMLTTLPPIYGLYMSFFPVLVYFFFGSSKHISVGTFSVVCLMIGTTVARGYESHKSDLTTSSPDTTNVTDDNVPSKDTMSPEEINLRLTFAISLTFMVGIMQLIMGIARLGFITVYLSDPLISGFTTGATCHVYASQVKNIFGVETGQYSGPFKLIYTYRDFFGNVGSQIKWASLITSLISWIILYCVTRFINHNQRFRRKMFMPVPIELIVVVLGTVLSYAFELKQNFSVATVGDFGDIPVGLPNPTSPFQHLDDVFLDAFALAVVVFAISISMARILAKKRNYEIDPNQELIAFGFCNIVSSFFASPSASASMSRSLVQERAGGKTQVAGLVSCVMLLVVMLAMGPYFKTLPTCVLAAIIMEKMRGMFLQVRDLKILWQISIIDSLVWIVALVATVLLDVDIGLGVAVAFALLTTICRSQRPYTCLMGRIPMTDLYQDISVYKKAEEIQGIKIFRCENSPLFLNVDHFREKLYKTTIDPWSLRISHRHLGSVPYSKESVKGYLQAFANGGIEMEVLAPNDNISRYNDSSCTDNHSGEQISINVISNNDDHTKCDFHTLILDCSSWNQVDTVGVKALMSIINEYKKVGVRVVLANCKDGIRETFEKTKFHTVIDRHDIFVSLHDAVQHAESQRDTRRQGESVAGSTVSLTFCDTKPLIANGNVKNGLRLYNVTREFTTMGISMQMAETRCLTADRTM